MKDTVKDLMINSLPSFVLAFILKDRLTPTKMGGVIIFTRLFQGITETLMEDNTFIRRTGNALIVGLVWGFVIRKTWNVLTKGFNLEDKLNYAANQQNLLPQQEKLSSNRVEFNKPVKKKKTSKFKIPGASTSSNQPQIPLVLPMAPEVKDFLEVFHLGLEFWKNIEKKDAGSELNMAKSFKDIITSTIELLIIDRSEIKLANLERRQWELNYGILSERLKKVSSIPPKFLDNLSELKKIVKRMEDYWQTMNLSPKYRHLQKKNPKFFAADAKHNKGLTLTSSVFNNPG